MFKRLKYQDNFVKKDFCMAVTHLYGHPVVLSVSFYFFKTLCGYVEVMELFVKQFQFHPAKFDGVSK